MKCPLLAIVRRHTESGPDAAGATSENLLPRRPRRGQAAAPLAFSGLKIEALPFSGVCKIGGGSGRVPLCIERRPREPAL
jgi:hypothetical protein